LAQTDIQTYLEQGKQALAHGQGREAAIAYAHAAQIEPDNPLVHLGLAEANLALGAYDIVRMACQKTQELAPDGPMHDLAQALLDLLDRRYDQALQQTDAAIKNDPANAYAHALRAYLLRMTHQDYDAGLARSRASRLSFGGTFENCFPPVEPIYANGYAGRLTGFASSAKTPAGGDQAELMQPLPKQQQSEQIPPWSRPNSMQRRMIRTRFWLSQNPRFLTSILIGLNVLAYFIVALMAHEFIDLSDQNGLQTLVNMGAQVNSLITHGQYWRLFTAMFLHFSIFHIGLNMLSLFFVGIFAEVFYGKWRYLVIYLVSGVIGGLAVYISLGTNNAVTVSAGASGAIAGIFGATGAFFIVNRRALGPAGNAMLGQWLFWLLFNVVFNIYDTGLAWQDHLGGLIAGVLLGIILLPPLRRRTRRV